MRDDIYGLLCEGTWRAGASPFEGAPLPAPPCRLIDILTSLTTRPHRTTIERHQFNRRPLITVTMSSSSSRPHLFLIGSFFPRQRPQVRLAFRFVDIPLPPVAIRHHPIPVIMTEKGSTDPWSGARGQTVHAGTLNHLRPLLLLLPTGRSTNTKTNHTASVPEWTDQRSVLRWRCFLALFLFDPPHPHLLELVRW